MVSAKVNNPVKTIPSGTQDPKDAQIKKLTEEVDHFRRILKVLQRKYKKLTEEVDHFRRILKVLQRKYNQQTVDIETLLKFVEKENKNNG